MRLLNLNGKVFGRLTVLERHSPRGGKKIFWLCRCSCGKECIVMGSNLRAGFTRSCGCLFREQVGARIRTHGMSGTREYHTWTSMVGRCTRPHYPSFRNYGGRGIKVCKRWLGAKGFANFLKDMGARPSDMSLDRINNDGDYKPSNCRWATDEMQRKNR
jgi:hypothetical protein